MHCSSSLPPLVYQSRWAVPIYPASTHAIITSAAHPVPPKRRFVSGPSACANLQKREAGNSRKISDNGSRCGHQQHSKHPSAAAPRLPLHLCSVLAAGSGIWVGARMGAKQRETRGESAHGLKRRASPSSEMPLPVSATAIRSSRSCASNVASRETLPRVTTAEGAGAAAAAAVGCSPEPAAAARGAAAVNLIAF